MKLGDILVIQEKSKIKAGDAMDNGNYPFFTCSNDIIKTYDSAQYKGPALIFGTGGKASVHFCDTEFSTSTDCLTYYPVSSEVNLDLINQYLQSNIYLLENGFKGAGLRHISRDYIANIEINLPNINTQNCIVKKLNKTKNIIEKSKKILVNYDLLIKSRFIEMFGDNPVDNGIWRIEKLCKLVDVTSSKRIYAEEQSTEGIPFLRISDLVSKINGKNTCDLFIPVKKYEVFLKDGLVPNIGDILVTSRGTLGLCYIITDNDKFYFQDGMITWLKFSNHEELLSVYLSYLFAVILKQLIDSKTNGATIKYVSISELKEINIPVPPIELQQRFAAFVQQVDKSKFVVQKSLEKAETLYKSLMQEYFG